MFMCVRIAVVHASEIDEEPAVGRRCKCVCERGDVCVCVRACVVPVRVAKIDHGPVVSGSCVCVSMCVRRRVCLCVRVCVSSPHSPPI